MDAKLQRAITHLNNVEREIRAFADLKPFSVRVDVNANPGFAWYFAVDNRVGPPNIDIALEAGEAVYQLRSALDHLVHQLVTASGNPGKLQGSRRHQFPIFETQGGYDARASAMIDGVSPSIADRILATQPFQRRPKAPRHDPLWVLQDLNNTDKHRVIPLAVAGLDILQGRRSMDDVTYVESWTARTTGPLTDGQVLMGHSLTEHEPFVDATLSSTVSFAEHPNVGGVIADVNALLTKLVTDVAAVIESFRTDCS